MTLFKNLLLFVVFLGNINLIVLSQSSITKLTYNGISYRHNFCPQQQAFLAGNISLNNVLKGLEVTIGINDLAGSNKLHMAINQSTGYPYAGFMYDIQKSLATLGNFKIKYVQVPKRSSLDYSLFFQKITPLIDFYGASWYSDSTDRRISGIGFTSTIIDASLLFVTKQSIEQQTDLFAFAYPFNTRLWLVIVAILIFNGAMQWLLREKKREHEHTTLLTYLYLSCASFPGSESIPAANRKMEILNLGFSYLVLILVSSYTASLASFLISQSIAVSLLNSIDDADAAKAIVCVEASSYAEKVIKSSYSGLKTVSVVDPALSLSNGLCDGCVLG